MKITLTNNFHNTSVNINCEVLSHIHNEATAYPTAGQIKKAKKALCGIDGCTCSGEDGTRGRQELPSGKRLVADCSAIYASGAK
jgi:hypothetical protein